MEFQNTRARKEAGNPRNVFARGILMQRREPILPTLW
jgi:hypothetical protein